MRHRVYIEYSKKTSEHHCKSILFLCGDETIEQLLKEAEECWNYEGFGLFVNIKLHLNKLTNAEYIIFEETLRNREPDRFYQNEEDFLWTTVEPHELICSKCLTSVISNTQLDLLKTVERLGGFKSTFDNIETLLNAP